MPEIIIGAGLAGSEGPAPRGARPALTPGLVQPNVLHQLSNRVRPWGLASGSVGNASIGALTREWPPFPGFLGQPLRTASRFAPADAMPRAAPSSMQVRSFVSRGIVPSPAITPVVPSAVSPTVSLMTLPRIVCRWDIRCRIERLSLTRE